MEIKKLSVEKRYGKDAAEILGNMDFYYSWDTKSHLCLCHVQERKFKTKTKNELFVLLGAN